MKTQTILFGAIAALLSIGSLPTQAKIVTPAPSFGNTDALTPGDVQEFAAKDVSRIRGNIARALAKKTAFTDILAGGTLESGVSDTVRSVIQERAVLNQSLVRPTFVADKDMCGQVGEAAEVGSTEYSYELQTLRGMGPLVCVKGMRNAFKGAYSVAEDALRKQIVHLISADVRINLTDRCGSKLVVAAGKTFEEMFTGDAQEIDTLFTPDFLPGAPVNFELLHWASIFLKENLLVEGFEGKQSEPTLKFIGSQEIITKLRDEAGVVDNHRALTTGQYKIGERALTGYTWEGPYRGISFGVDPQPLRFSEVDEDGQPIYIEPEIARATTNKVAARINPAWQRARYEVALLVGANSFKKLTPAHYSGEGGFQFPAQVSMGEMKFKVIEDNDNNVWADWGRHFYQVSRAYEPVRPHAVMAIAFKRRSASFSLTDVSDYPDYSSTDSI